MKARSLHQRYEGGLPPRLGSELPGLAPMPKAASVWLQQPIWMGALCVLALTAARLIPHLPFALPPCGFRLLTGVPCPLCGATHALIAWAHIELTQAVRFNPLVAIAPVLVFVWLAVDLVGRWLRRDWAGAVMMRLGRRPWPAVLLGLAMMNWVYLIVWLPR